MNLDKLLTVAVRGGASDIILKTNAVPRFRFKGDLIPLSGGQPLSAELMEEWLKKMVPAHLQGSMQDLLDADFAYQSESGHRFRVNLFRQRGQFALVLRIIANHIRTLEELQLPKILEDFTQEKRGIILVTGATGSGKSTTLAAMIEKINTSRASHIITIEDPIEFTFKEKSATIEQREIGTDTASFGDALRSALRQNPDVIFVGELRDRETTQTALMAAETGHLVLSTLHTTDAVETMTRLLSYFPVEQHTAMRLTLSQTLRAIVSQRLVIRADDSGMVPALEILIANELVREEIREGKNLKALKDALKRGLGTNGMQSFDQSLLSLVQRGHISHEEAVRQASNPKDLELALQGFGR